ncbi:DUF2278 family protein [Massilia horti]|uniref:DUF2278 family protein n=1 Tax=Massilia horti TaxID=2562153 RepID=A0A4Y9T063_9BURK|nr:DUF2278 family protein [Massilia horti]TFW32470.1 DUF2278 family protein [Massilia horti]
MALTYGVVKAKVIGAPVMKAKFLQAQHETQYHMHVRLQAGSEQWDSAVNVGTDDADDLLRYRLAYDFHHEICQNLRAMDSGFLELRARQLPALDFLRSDILNGTGHWRDSDVMDGTAYAEPPASLSRLLHRAQEGGCDVYLFGRTYRDGEPGIHDIHMNQGSTGPHFLNNGNDRIDHNDVWQDGAVLVDLGLDNWAAYFTAFTQQLVPTDDAGNPTAGAHEIRDSDPGGAAKSAL